jgi:hypothetical protein
MKSKRMLISVGIVASLAVVCGIAIHAAEDQNKYTLKVPNGLAVSEFKGYESWQLISISRRGDMIAAIPPQANDAKCGIVCHMATEDRDYVFTKYAVR